MALVYVSYNEETEEIYLNIIDKESQNFQKLKLSPMTALRLSTDLLVMIQPFLTSPLEIPGVEASGQQGFYKSPIGLNGSDQEEKS